MSIVFQIKKLASILAIILLITVINIKANFTMFFIFAHSTTITAKVIINFKAPV